METEAYIALGSNMGDRELNLLRAVAEVGKLPGCRVTGLSAFYETSPVGGIDQPSFYNGVLRLATELPPRELLERLLHIESDVFGRVRTVQWGPRPMDLDLLLYGSMIVEEEGLIVPHPRMAERRFVLEPLCNLAPGLVHPVLGQTVAQLLKTLRSDESVAKLQPEILT
ncbi:2-amino-4-hydroxy-6-hydroxymethyldihydropteridine diphosphokinase [Oryzomonas rubra]|uniref:2-amino-4-hydroxy-6-hydroxymethyldihydropteridine pyrophosphokinase n=1 Tax=Oryzomonas rubra TaxID=2509454 RepID=A0A5A9XH32_9BACT|nr:2-amino-4-hydroxy-6-hydroxymethyldihydropteridine diphosphokinase [Oryzomonas rubra]KAA0891379.1 2-amino-4-hydroxy-6-hydroxymethyldihydropteridine diphosphokinase [Oryzomonas rubra]